MAHQNSRRQRTAKPLYSLAVLGALLVWVGLLISPIGSVVAAVTIFGLIVILFVLGCINVQGDDFRR